ncbi:MAG: T9SS type A sorting domain-containing protein [Bacteroidia bacterium]
MKFLFSMLLALPILAGAQGNAPFFHIQSVNVARADVLNDSVLRCFTNIDLQDMSSTDIIHFNMNTRIWERVGKVPSIGGQSILERIERTADSVIVVTGNGQVHFSADAGNTFQQATIPFSTTQTQNFNTFHRVFNGYLMRFSLSSLWHYYHSFNGVDWVYSGGISISNANQRLSFVGDSIYYVSIGTEIQLNTNGGRDFGASTGIGRFVPQNTNHFQAISPSLFFAWSSMGTHRTTDGGQNWTPMTIPGSSINLGLANVVFKNPSEGVLTFQQSAGVFYTLDGGTTLIAIPQPPNASGPAAPRYMGNKLLSGSGLFVDYTEDYGQTWKSLENNNLGPIYDIHFKGQLGIMVGESGRYMVSTNGGYWFERGVAPATSNYNTACHILNDTTFLLGNFNGSVFRSLDSGRTWVSAGGGGNNHVYRFKANAQGHVLTRRAQNGMYSNDFGHSNTNFGISQNVTNIFDVLPTVAQMRFARDHGTEFRVSSLTFPVQTSNSPVQISNFPRNNEELVDFVMATDQVGYILMRSPSEQFITYKTTDGGNNWVRQAGFSTPVTLSGAGLKFQALGADLLAVAQYPWNLNLADYNRVFISTNGGQSWQEEVLPVPVGISNFNIRSAHFFSTDVWWVGLRMSRVVVNGFANTTGGGSSSVAEKADAPQKIKLYPNPTRDYMWLELPENSRHQLRIYDMQGKLLLEQVLEGGRQELSLQLPAGMYLVQARSKHGSYMAHSRLVVQP